MDTPTISTETPPSVFKLFPLVERVVIGGKYLNNRIKQSIENCLRNLVEGVCSLTRLCQARQYFDPIVRRGSHIDGVGW